MIYYAILNDDQPNRQLTWEDVNSRLKLDDGMKLVAVYSDADFAYVTGRAWEKLGAG